MMSRSAEPAAPPQPSRVQDNTQTTLEAIAVVGLSCRLPGSATNAERLWDLLEAGHSAWTPFPKERFNDEGFRSIDPLNHVSGTTNTNGGHFLKQDPGAFDAPFFGIHAFEASAMDPQQRLLLEIGYQAFENAGLSADDLNDSNTSVYVGQWCSDYHEILARDTLLPPTYMTTGTGPAISSNRLSYHFNLKGPSFTLDTGCSASLVALHQAVQSLRSGESDRSFVAGVNLTLDPQRFVYQSRLKMFSNEGKSFPFDSRANGYGRGEGCSGVVLEPLSKALARGAPIRAIIRNSVVNQDGRTPGISVPSSQAQLDAIRLAYSQIGLPVAADYVEAHGTGTKIGDPIEAKAIAEAFKSTLHKPLPMGSIKGNIGHLESAAGLTALVKGILMLEHGVIPPQVNFQKPNPSINLDRLGLRIPLKSETVNLKRISINSFGYGGTNAHVILESWAGENTNNRPQTPDVRDFAQAPHIFALSAASEVSIQAMATHLISYIESKVASASSDSELLQTLAHTLAVRSRFEYRGGVIAADVLELKEGLQLISDNAPSQAGPRTTPCVGFAFSGQGAQYFNMGRELFATSRTFVESLARASTALNTFGCSWDAVSELHRTEKDSRVDDPQIAQVLSTAIQLALVDVMEAFGVSPSFVVGHSSGEIAAAYAARLLTFEDSMRVSYHRGRLTSQLLSTPNRGRGAMMAVGAAPEVVQEAIDSIENAVGKLRIACYNSPDSVTVSGDETFVDVLRANLETQGIFNRKLRTGGAAYHSHHMLPIRQEYADALQGIRALEGSPLTVMVSSVTMKEVRPGEITPDYWVRNLVSPVHFSSAVKRMASTQRGKLQIDIVQEIGTHTQLEGPIKKNVKALNTSRENIKYVGTLKRGMRADFALLSAVLSLFSLGVSVDLDAANGIKEQSSLQLLRDLPPYPFDHSKSYWHESRQSKVFKQRKSPPHELLGVPALGARAIEPEWRRFLSLDEIPWIRGHTVQGQIVFPGAAYIAMGVEALQQHVLASNPNAKFEEIFFRNISLDQALVLADNKNQVEISLSLRHETLSAISSSKDWQELRICSVTDSNQWTEHCRAQVRIKLAEEHDADAPFKAGKGDSNMVGSQQALENAEVVSADKFYYASKQLGLHWASPFDNVTSMERTRTWSVATVEPSLPTMRNVPQGKRAVYWMHPALLDSCLFHGLYAILATEDGFTDAVVPTFIKELTMSAKTAAMQFSQLTCTSTKTSAGLTFDVDVTAGDVSLLTAAGIRATRMSGTPSLVNRKLAHTLQWVPHMGHVSKDYIQQECAAKVSPGNIKQKNLHLDALAVSHMKHAVDQLCPDDIPDDYRRLWFAWMQEATTTMTTSVKITEEDLLIYKTDPAFQAIVRFGPELVNLLKGTQDPISLLVEDDVLTRIYSEERCRRCYTQIAAYCRKHGQQRPQLRILEIGAGSASGTLPILEALRDDCGRVMVSEYDFTDISAAFFGSAKEVLVDFGDVVSYKVLDIEQDPSSQGFRAGSYDIVVASNVIHATTSVGAAVKNASSLLKPGGKFILMEITNNQLFYNYIFGSFSGWWAGAKEGRTTSPLLSVEQWAEQLLKNGLDDVDPVFEDYNPSEGGSIKVFIANKTEVAADEKQTAEILIRSGSDTSSPTLEAAQRLQINVRSLSAACESPKVLILSPEICDVLSHRAGVTREDFDNLKRHMLGSTCVLLISWPLDETKRSSGCLIKGLSQCLRMEIPETHFMTLEISSSEVSSMTEGLATLMQDMPLVSSTAKEELETDYFWDGQQLYVSRVVPQLEMSNYITSATGLLEPQMGPFRQTERVLMAEPTIPGMVETIKWKDDASPEVIGPDSVKIQLCAASVNFKDVLIASGQLEGITSMQNDCSGVIVQVGSRMADRFKVGDRVCALYSRSYTNYPIVHGDCVHRIPDDMSFEDAASIPIVWITVYYSLVDLGRLQKGESILVHSAAGAIGHAAIMLAQYIDADIFVTVSTGAKKQLLMDRYGIPEDHIFSSRTTTFRNQILSKTGGRGVDVVLNFLSDDMFRASCDVVAKFGRFVEIGRKALMEDALMPMQFLLRNVTFAYADLALVIVEAKPLARRLLHAVFTLLHKKAISTIPIQTMPINEIETAFRTLQGSRHTGKLVLTVSDDQQVKLIPPSPVTPTLQESAAYLVVGGLGGLGRRICHWLVDRGAKNLIVASRSIETSAAGKSLAESLAQRGVSVSLVSCDVSSEESVQSLIRRSEFPIRGMIQAAMVLQDAMFEEMNIDQWFAAVDPKIKGTWNLHEYLPRDIDFFITLSSIVAASGNLGQSNYAAACSFQDALARYRATLGLSGHSINVGVVAEAGFVSENPTVATALKEQGFDTISVREFLAHLDYVVTNPRSDPAMSQSSLGLAPASDDKATWASSLTFSHLRQKGSFGVAKSGADTDTLSTITPAMQPAEIVGIITAAILKQLSKLIDIPFENLSAARSLNNYGVDSLVAVELRNWIAAALQATVSLLALRSTDSIAELAEIVARDSRITGKLVGQAA